MHTIPPNRVKGILFGLACGDAVGVTLEFQPRGSFSPIIDMIGSGPFNLEPGQWTDDTAMALCLAESLVQKQGFHAANQMKHYVQWFRKGHWSSNGQCFDIGTTTIRAIKRFEQTGNAFCQEHETQTPSNGSIMRLGPIVMFYHQEPKLCLLMAQESSRTTHHHPLCIEACRLFALYQMEALQAKTKNEILQGVKDHQGKEPLINALTQKAFLQKPPEAIKGTGYVVDSLEAALYCFFHTETFKDAILMASNLGDDADTTAAVCGQIAGAFYGLDGIPKHWIDQLARKEEVEMLVNNLLMAKPNQKTIPAIPSQ